MRERDRWFSVVAYKGPNQFGHLNNRFYRLLAKFRLETDALVWAEITRKAYPSWTVQVRRPS